MAPSVFTCKIVKLGVVSLTPLDVLPNMEQLLVVDGWSAQVSNDRVALVFVPFFLCPELGWKSF
jgi:hypothetical protein